MPPSDEAAINGTALGVGSDVTETSAEVADYREHVLVGELAVAVVDEADLMRHARFPVAGALRRCSVAGNRGSALAGLAPGHAGHVLRALHGVAVQVVF